VLQQLLDSGEALSADRVKELLEAGSPSEAVTVALTVPTVDLRVYDALLCSPHFAEVVSS